MSENTRHDHSWKDSKRGCRDTSGRRRPGVKRRFCRQAGRSLRVSGPEPDGNTRVLLETTN
eukprot:671863-Rhodomonas_salina.1